MSIQALDSIQISTVFDLVWLQDRDMLAFGITSKKMNSVAKEHLQKRDEMQAQLLSVYKMTRSYNVQCPKKVNLFCLGERHDDKPCLAAQAAFINFMASRGPILLLLEGWPSMKPIAINGWIWWITIDSAYANNCYAVGWDEREEQKRLDAEIEQEYRAQQVHLNKDRLVVFNEADKMPKVMEDEVVELLKEVYHFRMEDFFFEIMNTRFDRWENLAQRTNCFNSEDRIRLAYIDRQILNVQEADHKIKCEKIDKQLAATTKGFPGRTKGMIRTLQQLQQLRSNFGIPHAKAILRAGNAHLECTIADQDKPEHDLTTFYEELKNHRAVVYIWPDDHARS